MFLVLQTVVGGAGLSAASATFLLGVLLITDVFCNLVLVTVKISGAISAGIRDCFMKDSVMVLLRFQNNWVWKKLVYFSV